MTPTNVMLMEKLGVPLPAGGDYDEAAAAAASERCKESDRGCLEVYRTSLASEKEEVIAADAEAARDIERRQQVLSLLSKRQRAA